MQLIALWIAWSLFLWFCIRGRATLRRVVGAFSLLCAFSGAVALADPGGTTTSTGDPLGDLQRTLTVALTGVLVGAVTALAKRAWDWLGHSSAGKKVENLADELGAKKTLADAAINYADQMEKKAGKALSDSELAAHARDFLKAHGVAADAVDAMSKLVESQLGARHAAEVAANKLANAAKNMRDAMTTGELAQNLAKLRAMDAAATKPDPLPPAPPAGKAA